MSLILRFDEKRRQVSRHSSRGFLSSSTTGNVRAAIAEKIDSLSSESSLPEYQDKRELKDMSQEELYALIDSISEDADLKLAVDAYIVIIEKDRTKFKDMSTDEHLTGVKGEQIKQGSLTL